jgi:hypothetical protein
MILPSTLVTQWLDCRARRTAAAPNVVIQTGQDELLVRTGNNKAFTQWSRDGRFIAYSELDPKTKRDLWILPMEGDESPNRSLSALGIQRDLRQLTSAAEEGFNPTLNNAWRRSK